MNVRKFSANYIYTGTGEVLKNGIIEIDNNGSIVRVIDTKGQLAELSNMEFHSGVIVPGFVNTHCHLELSHLRGQIERHTGLADFVAQIQHKRHKHKPYIERATQQADAEMYQQGIVAVGDISNSQSTVKHKTKSKIFYHTFIEVFGLDSNRATEIFDTAWHTKLAFSEKNLSCSITPHAPYSVSPKLFKQLSEYMQNSRLPMSFHNQETESENEFFCHGSGDLHEAFRAAGLPVGELPPTGKSSLQSTLPYFPSQNKLLLVHNTYSSEDDIVSAIQKHPSLYWALCPNANLFIENKLPNIEKMRNQNAKICLGTDSLASNDQLSIIEEMITINEYFPQIPFEEMLAWATINGAEALGVSSKFGTIEKGKTPGLVLIQGFDYDQMQISDVSFSRRLV